jgi:sugar phosphate isomerase/epimerase
VFEIANALDAKYVRVFSFYPADGEDIRASRDAVLANLERLLDLADEYGVTLCHENEANIYGEGAEECYDLLAHFGGRRKCVFDMGNFVFCNKDPESAYELLKPYIQYFHIKDACYEGAIVPPGKGDAKIGEILHNFADSADRDVIATLEPHLETFSGLRHLVGRKFENPYKFETKELAFDEAVRLIKEIIK